MAENPVTLPEIITVNDRNLADVELPSFLDRSPFMANMAASIASHDTLHKWLLWAMPPVGFRAPNDGREVDSSQDEMQTEECKILDASFRTDLALAESYRKGGASGWMNREAGRHLRAAFFKAEQQVYGGTAVEATGFRGFNDLPNLSSLGEWCISAGGSTASQQTSAYVVRGGMEDVEIITGRSGDISIKETTIQETPGTTTGTYPGLYTPIHAWYCLKMGSNVDEATGSPVDVVSTRPSVVRICNIETSLTDDLFYQAISKFGDDPTHIFMSARALELLRASRTATNPSGNPAPRPTEIEGIPVFKTDGIGRAEAVVT